MQIMKTSKTCIPQILITIALLFGFLTSCDAQTVRPKQLPQSIYITSYETRNHVLRVTVRNPTTGNFEKIDIELEDEFDTYNFAVNDREYAIRYFRTGNKKQGCTGVFVVFENQLYQISSPFKRLNQ